MCVPSPGRSGADVHAGGVSPFRGGAVCVCDMNKTPGTQGDSRPASRKKTVVWQGCRDSGGMPGEGMQKVRRGDSPKFRKK